MKKHRLDPATFGVIGNAISSTGKAFFSEKVVRKNNASIS
jgi:hypothetical protein